MFSTKILQHVLIFGKSWQVLTFSKGVHRRVSSPFSPKRGRNKGAAGDVPFGVARGVPEREHVVLFGNRRDSVFPFGDAGGNPLGEEGENMKARAVRQSVVRIAYCLLNLFLIAQWLERSAVNRQVVGSTPT